MSICIYPTRYTLSLRMCNCKADSHYYVYEWFRPDTNACFHVGKGKGKRAWSYRSRNHIFRRITIDLTDKRLKPTVRIYKSNLTNREALKLERERMAYWAGKFVTLSNKTGTYRRSLKQLRRMRNRIAPEVMARARRIFG
jgi:hypothetical protein